MPQLLLEVHASPNAVRIEEHFELPRRKFSKQLDCRNRCFCTPVPKKVPELNTVIRLIAQRGGFLARKGDGEPGVKSIWLGLQDVAVFVEGIRYARQTGGI